MMIGGWWLVEKINPSTSSGTDPKSGIRLSTGSGTVQESSAGLVNLVGCAGGAFCLFRDIELIEHSSQIPKGYSN